MKEGVLDDKGSMKLLPMNETVDDNATPEGDDAESGLESDVEQLADGAEVLAAAMEEMQAMEDMLADDSDEESELLIEMISDKVGVHLDHIAYAYVVPLLCGTSPTALQYIAVQNRTEQTMLYTSDVVQDRMGSDTPPIFHFRSS